MYSRLHSVSRGFYLAGIVLALVLVIPTPWFPFQLAKVAAFAVFLFVSVVLFILGGGMRELVRSHGFKAALLVALLPLTYALSYYFSTDKSVGLTGFSLESDTVVFTLLLFLGFIGAFALFRTLRTVRLLQTVVFWSLVAATIFQCVSIVFGSAAIPLATFADRSVNLVGKWNDLGLLVGLLAVFLIAHVELGSTSAVRKLVVGIVLAVLGVLLGVVNFPLVWTLVLGFCVVLAIVAFLTRRGDAQTPGTWVLRTPWYALVGAVVALLFIFFGSNLNLHLTSLFPVSSLEVRPSYSSTLGVIDAARAGSLRQVLIGTGPNTFGESWLMHKPAEVNQSQFWNIDFNVGFSSFVTALGTVGLLGVIAWLLPILLVLGGLVRAVRWGILNREDITVASTLGIGSLFLLASIILYVPSQNILILAFALSGAVFGFLMRQGQSRTESEENPSGLMQIAAIVAMIVLVVLSGAVGFISGKRLIAQAKVGHGSSLLGSGDIDGAINDATNATKLDKTSDSLRLTLAAYTAKLQQIAATSSKATAELQKLFADTGQAALTVGQVAEALNPLDYRPTFLLGQMYEYLASIGVQGAADRASQIYQSALVKNPTNPTILLALARLEATRNDKQKTADYLTQTLKLKPNYTDAILLVVQLDVANNDVEGAIRAATAAAQTAPGVAPIWFELGLLYYSKGDSTHAAQALEQAVSLVSNYANAKYFLGLSYYNLGRIPEAVKQFQDLQATNPDSAEVKLILSNLLAGKKPFDGAVPPVTPTPENRSSAPVAE